MSALSRLALGTAQFGLRYGVANVLGQVGEPEAARMLECAYRAGVRTLDTAIAYGSSEQCLGRMGLAGWEVVTKLPALPVGVKDVGGWVEGQVRESMARLGVVRIPVLLLHRPADLLGVNGAAYLRALHAQRAVGFVGEVGVSIYSPVELDALWPVFRPAVVQAPFNVLDQRIVSSGWFARLRAEGVRVMSRSAFLQGLLLIPRGARPAYFAPWEGVLNGWLDWCEARGRRPLDAALQFVLSQGEVDRVVVGADSLAHLNEILGAAARECDAALPDFSSENVGLIDPSRWVIQ